MRLHRAGAFLAAFLLAAAVIPAQDLPLLMDAQEEVEESEPREPAIFGFIFNTSNLLFDLEPYLGGFGGKLLYPEYALRGMARAGYQSTTRRFDLGIGIAYERPFFRGRINPYIGAVTALDFSTQYSETSEDDWIRINSLSATLGGILGLELFIVDFLSVFAEYEVAGRLARTMVKQSVAGELTETPTVNYYLGSGLGNNSSIGVVIYLKPTGLAPREE